MNESCANEEKYFFSKMLRLSEIYKSTKHLILLTEYYNSKHGIVVSTINELRNALDHVMRSLLNIDQMPNELYKAEGHLYRAVYDACEIIVLDRLKYIEEFKNDVSYSFLNKIIPHYYTETLPYITKLKEQLVAVRQVPNSVERIKEYENTIEKLMAITDELDKVVPQISEYKHKTNKRKYYSTYTFTILLGAWAAMYTIFSMIWDINSSALLFLSLSSSLLVILLYFLRLKKRIKL